MKYPKDPFYLNTSLRNQKANNQEIFDDGFYNLLELLVNNKESNVYEVGFDFGQRLLYLQENGVKVLGGVEFNPNFGLYKKHANLYDHGWTLHFTNLEYWNPARREVIITNHFLDLFQEKDREILLQKLVNSADKLYLNENLDLDFPQENGVYVTFNKRGDDLQEHTEGMSDKKLELPNFDSLKNGFNHSGQPNETDIEDSSNQDDTSSGL